MTTNRKKIIKKIIIIVFSIVIVVNIVMTKPIHLIESIRYMLFVREMVLEVSEPLLYNTRRERNQGRGG